MEKKLIPLEQPSELLQQSEKVDFMADFIQKFCEIRLEVTSRDIVNWMNSNIRYQMHLQFDGE